MFTIVGFLAFIGFSAVTTGALASSFGDYKFDREFDAGLFGTVTLKVDKETPFGLAWERK